MRFYQTYFCLIYYYPVEILRTINDESVYRTLIVEIPELFLEYFQGIDELYGKKLISLGLISIFHNHSSANLNENLAKMCFVNLINMLGYVPKETEENIQLEGKVNQKRPERNTREEELDDEYFNHNGKIDLTSPDKIRDDLLSHVHIKEQNTKLVAKLKEYVFPIMREDEYVFFQKIFNDLKKTNSNFENVI
eukprot:CAMPEP_0114580720 /NCGR_PEP_ID=MMETSP0125-20121206/4938_1 /TAXON_ID=485358 ORGANISM="Aristerostoma sp., Strain ATCC 50986" /NCGR_SAMPLE_ID=MMETSP0125 /ASSEMBLY_ACC=CAM_ASM_000245 /LENGTH=192 /DNA_ID=CAMNT_0001772429 /DNA_START=2567 /DNA_END=3145 /DNA_ORIENTATION=+